MTSIIHIHAPKGYYIGQVKGYGERRWTTVTGRCRTYISAMRKAIASMGGMHRARVLFLADWYEPNIVMECKR